MQLSSAHVKYFLETRLKPQNYNIQASISRSKSTLPVPLSFKYMLHVKLLNMYICGKVLTYIFDVHNNKNICLYYRIIKNKSININHYIFKIHLFKILNSLKKHYFSIQPVKLN